MKLSPVKPFAKAAPGFNHRMAKLVYDEIMKCDSDEAAQMLSRMIIFDALNRDVTAHEPFFNKVAHEQVAKRAEKMKAELVRQYMQKRLKGESVDEVVKATEYLSKAFTGEAFDPEHRAERAKARRRAANGQFVREHQKIQYTGHEAKPIHPNVFNRLFPDNHPTNLNERQRARYQQAYQQIDDLISPYRGHPLSFVHLKYANGYEDIIPVDQFKGTDIRSNNLTNKLDRIAVSVVPSNNDMPGVIYSVAGGGHVGAGLAQNMQRDQGALTAAGLRGYRESQDLGDDVHQPGAALYNRIGTGAQLLDDTFGNIAPPKVKAALTTGKFIGDYGPEAQKVIGPRAQKTAYRYRGVERSPDPALMQAYTNALARVPNADAASKRNAIIYGTHQRGNHYASPVITYFHKLLPNTNLNMLQRFSGNIPPSQGIILDRSGKITTQAVGYGDDWYLPFNLKKLKGLNGGEYIRTRTYGGPTTEDIYTALVSGAKSLTVVSHNGVYTVDFAPDFTGKRRYNDKAARMVGRYGHLLDAVESRQVQPSDIHPSRLREIEQEAADNVGTDNKVEYGKEVRRLSEEEAKDPKLSEEMANQAKREVLLDYAQSYKTPDGHVFSLDDLRKDQEDKAVNALATEAQRVYGKKMTSEQERQFRNLLREKLSTDDGLIEHLGLQDQLDAKERATKRDLKANLSPLSLNGQGYYKALQALQEQFPYYIENPTFTPWVDSENRTDTGYIKPKHIRPKGALHGYFDSTVNGRGKVTADSVAYGRKLNHYRGEAPAETETSTSAPSPSAKKTDEGKIDEDARALADRKLHDHLLAVYSRGNGLEIAPPQGAAPDAFDMYKLLNMSPDEAEEEVDSRPEAYHQMVLSASKNAQKFPQFFPDLDHKLIRQVARNGQEDEAEADWSDDRPLSLEREYNFGPRFSAARNHSAEDLRATYANDPDIKFARAAHDIPELGDGDMDTRRIGGKIREELVENRNLARRGNPRARQRVNELTREAKGSAKAAQLHRRFNELGKNEPVHVHDEEAPEVRAMKLSDFEQMVRNQLGGGTREIEARRDDDTTG